MNALSMPAIRSRRLGRVATYALPLAIAALAAGTAYAGADTTFTPALTKFTYKLCSIYVLSRFDQIGN